MEKHFDLKVEDCRQNLYNALNTSGLPMSVLNMLVNELQNTVNQQYVAHLENLRREEAQKIAQEELEKLEEENAQ